MDTETIKQSFRLKEHLINKCSVMYIGSLCKQLGQNHYSPRIILHLFGINVELC